MDLRVAALNRGPSHAFYQNESGDFYISYISNETAVFQPFEDFKLQAAEYQYDGISVTGRDVNYSLFSGVNSTEKFFAEQRGDHIYLYSGDSYLFHLSGENPIFVVFLNKSGAEDYLRLFYTVGSDLRYREQTDGFFSSSVSESGAVFSNSQYLAILGETFEPFRASLLHKKEGRFFEAYSSQDINYVKSYLHDFDDYSTGIDSPSIFLGRSFKSMTFFLNESYQLDFESDPTGVINNGRFSFDFGEAFVREENLSFVLDFDENETGINLATGFAYPFDSDTSFDKTVEHEYYIFE